MINIKRTYQDPKRQPLERIEIGNWCSISIREATPSRPFAAVDIPRGTALNAAELKAIQKAIDEILTPLENKAAKGAQD